MSKKNGIQLSVLTISILVIFIGVSYAFMNMKLSGTKRQVLTSGTLSLELLEDENNLMIENAMPMYDEVGMIQPAFTFRLTNESPIEANYILELKEIEVKSGIDRSNVKYGLTKNGEVKIDLVSNIMDNLIDKGTIGGNETIEYELRLWIKDSVTDMTKIENKAMRFRMSMRAEQEIEKYTEEILNGADPVLGESLIPVVIEDDGTVRKADVKQEWYSYSKQRWANAVVLEDNTKEYTEGEEIPEVNIESYFVWIPKYSYQLWDLGKYTGITSIDNTKVHSIPIKFGLNNTSDSNDGECTTPTTAGAVGNCKIGDYMTHPAFLVFDNNGFWVGKFESGYRGATSMVGAHQNSGDSSKLIIKPNVYSWRSITIGNAFKVSYDYLRDDESHMMKNTEWGAVAYLQHSIYGSQASVRNNNNKNYLTGYAAVSEPTCGHNNEVSIACNTNGTTLDVTQPYNTEIGYLASTTGNISGIYDMSGGSWEHIMAYNTKDSVGGSSRITSIYADFFSSSQWRKYYDQYSSTTGFAYNARILGDATGEMGGFANITIPNGTVYHTSSWYGDFASFLQPERPWFVRGGSWQHGSLVGEFAFDSNPGIAYGYVSFRVVLAL